MYRRNGMNYQRPSIGEFRSFSPPSRGTESFSPQARGGGQHFGSRLSGSRGLSGSGKVEGRGSGPGRGGPAFR
jgi:hypothetical protein